MMRLMLLFLSALLALSCGYGEGSDTCEEDVEACLNDFIAGAEQDACMDNVPLCQTTAGCSMDDTKYVEGNFPGFVNFAVTTSADATIVVRLFLKTQGHPGENTEINWYEPGCSESYTYESMGADVFAVAGADRVFEQEQQVSQEGLHLVEIYSDATTNYYLRVELQ